MTTAAVRSAIPNVFFWTVAPGPKPAIRPAGPVLDVRRSWPAEPLAPARSGLASRPARGSSPLLATGAEKDDVEVAEPVRVGVQGDTGDLPVADGEREDDLRPAAGRPYGRRNAVN